MISPMMTVVVLAVLWLIVVIPMLVKRKDDRAGERSAARFGSAMRALSTSRSLSRWRARSPPVDLDERTAPPVSTTTPKSSFPGRCAGDRRAPSGTGRHGGQHVPRPHRKADLSEARRQMMAPPAPVADAADGRHGARPALGHRRRWRCWPGRSALVFTASLGGYLLFLRNQALRDRDRRESRQQRSGAAARPWATTPPSRPALQTGVDDVVRIDDEDVELRGMADTIDLTGLYVEEEFDERAMRRAV